MTRAVYFKRYRMELPLAGAEFPAPALPGGFAWVAWHDREIDAHAEAKFLAFQGEADGQIFPSLATADGCRQLMRAIRARPAFCPAATWLVAAPDGPAGTIQGLCDADGNAMIQNLGIAPEHRRLGLGAALLAKALAGFARAGAVRVSLEVTAQNGGAMALYRSFGFRSLRTIYKAAPGLDARAAGGKLSG